MTDSVNLITDAISIALNGEFGDGYTSRQILTGLGFGYTVCEKCYKQEQEEENEARKAI